METEKNSANLQESSKTFMCVYDGCDKKFKRLSHLSRHEKIHQNITFRCEECGEIFTVQYALKRHIDNKHLKINPKKYQCRLCDEDFNKKSWLNHHIYKHTGLKPYACNFGNCESRFLTPSKLKRHMKVHEGYTCPKEDCNENFSKWTEVRKHLKLFHPKLYKCPECDQIFSKSNNLKSHLVTHNSNREVYLCPEKGCHHFYSTKSNLIHHVTSYHEKRPFHCPFGHCSGAYKSQEDLDVHVLKHTSSARLKKKKKKNKTKPSFAEKLAGLAPKKWQTDVSKNNMAKLSLDSSLDSASDKDNSEPTLQDVKEKTVIQVLSVDSASTKEDHEPQIQNVAETSEVTQLLSNVENCNEMTSETNNEEQNMNDNDNHDNCMMDNEVDSGIQNDNVQAFIIEKQKHFDTIDTVQSTNCILLEA